MHFVVRKLLCFDRSEMGGTVSAISAVLHKHAVLERKSVRIFDAERHFHAAC